MLPLEGLRILDLSRLLPGPYCTLLLADLGADVIKIEEPQGGDYIRHMPPSAGESSALFHALNRNKRSVTLDLKKPGGVEAFLTLVQTADVVVESFRPGVMDRLGLGYAALSKANPKLIFCAISGYGATGPLAHRAGHDLNYIARSGVLGYGGEAHGTPALPGVQIADVGGGSLLAAVGILAALQERAQTGKGRFVDISMCEGSLAFLHMHLGGRLAQGPAGAPLQRGTEALNGGYPCYGVYATRDGRHLSVAALEPKFWNGFCAAVERPDLADQGWNTGAAGEASKREVARVVAARTLAEWEAFLADKDLCCEPVRDGDEVLTDPLHVARGITFDIHDPREGRAITHLITPLRMGEPPKRPAPGLGEHNEEVLAAAGLSPAKISALKAGG